MSYYLTEAEANHRRCQESFAGQPIYNSQIVQRMAHTVAVTASPNVMQATLASPSHCIGSACMAWRWQTENVRGYCGKAGKP